MAGYGTCRLTGKSGNFVKAHIIPEALTKPSVPGESFIQAGQGDRPVRRWTSWYDQNLVTSDGERILSDYDNWGIAELRRLNLVWSSPATKNVKDFADWKPTNDHGHGVRIFEYHDGNKLRLFLLSILWRAAASRMPEFKHVRIPERQLKQLGKMLLDQNAKPHFLFASCLIQLTTVGPRHNFTPMAGKKRAGIKKKDQTRIFRFYFDGLALHFHRDPSLKEWRSMGDLCIQEGKQIGVVTVPYERSMQHEIMEREAALAEADWPSVMFRLAK